LQFRITGFVSVDLSNDCDEVVVYALLLSTDSQQLKYLLSTIRAAHKAKHKYFRSYDPKALAHYQEFYPEVTAQCEVLVRHRTAMDRTSVQFNEELLNSPGQTLSIHSLFTLVFTLVFTLLVTLYSLSIHSLFTLYSLSIHSVLTLLFTLYSLSIHSLFTLYSVSIHSLFTLYSLSYSLSIHSLFTLYSLSIHSYSLSVDSLFALYSFFFFCTKVISIHSLFTRCMYVADFPPCVQA
jgi:hypothetical protein